MAEEVVALDLDVRLQNAQSLKELRDVLRDSSDAAIGMDKGSAEYTKFVEIAAKAKAEIFNFNKELKALNPVERAQAFRAFGATMVGGFQAAAGALAVFTGDNQELNNILLKSMAIVNALNGLQAIADARRQFANIAIILGLKKQVAAQIEVTAATEASEVATGKISAATKIWNEITSVNPWFILIGVLIAAAGVVLTLTYQSNENAKALVRQKEANDLLIDAIKTNVQNIEAQVKTEIELAKAMGATEAQIRSIIRAGDDRTIAELKQEKAAVQSNLNIQKAQLKTLENEGILISMFGTTSRWFGASQEDITKAQKAIIDTNKLLTEIDNTVASKNADKKTQDKADMDEKIQNKVNEIKRLAALEEAQQIDSYDEQKAALQKELELYKNNADKRAEILNQIKILTIKHNEELKKIQEQQVADRIAAEDEEFTIREERKKNEYAAEDLLANTRIAGMEAGYNKELAGLREKFKEELTLYKNNGQMVLQLTENFEKAKRDLQIKYTKDAIFGLAEAFQGALQNQKSAALVQIGIDEAKAIAGLLATSFSSESPLNLVTGGLAGIANFATGMVAIISGIAKAKQLLSGGGDSGGGSAPSFGGGSSAPTISTGNFQSQSYQSMLNDAQRRRDYPVYKTYVVATDMSKAQATEEKLKMRAIHH